MRQRDKRTWFLVASFLLVPALALAANAFISPFTQTTTIASTVPQNGDLNPYGVAIVPRTLGKLKQGNVLVSNFNNSANLQGQGTTIVQIAPNGNVELFAQLDDRGLAQICPGGVGLTTALVALKTGWVIVGSLPTTGPNAAFAGPGCLLVLNAEGQVVEAIRGKHNEINGPWDMTAVDHGNFVTLFVTNVLNGNVENAGGAVVNQGTVVRLELTVPACEWGAVPYLRASRVIGSGFSERTDPDALIVGPTGVGFNKFDGKLYVTDTVNNRIAAIPDALFREHTAYAGEDVTANLNLNQPLGLAIAPNGNILTVNAGDGNIVETTPQGAQIDVFTLIPNGAGDLFGLAVAPGNKGIYFVNDGDNTLDLFH